MPKLVANGAKLACSEGLTPGTLTVPPTTVSEPKGMPAATVMHHVPMANIGPFGMCKTLANPRVAAATSAASGTLMPQPCIPVVSAPWTPGSVKVDIAAQKALTDNSTCACMWTGQISITDAGSEVEAD